VKITAKNNKSVTLRKLVPGDYNSLCHYFQQLRTDTIRRFGPHPFDIHSISQIYSTTGLYSGYIAIEEETSTVIAYAVVKHGYLEHDRKRLESYGLTLSHITDCSYAPSVADEWQSLGIGNALFHHILSDIKGAEIMRIILWGGVQADNDKAINFYKRNGFISLGEFEYNGWNYDMIFNI
jgi:GNAT superfamily N-acetyltransferase